MSRIVSYSEARSAVWSIPENLPPTAELTKRLATISREPYKPSEYVRMAAVHIERGLTIDEVLYLFIQSELARRAEEVRKRAAAISRARRKAKNG